MLYPQNNSHRQFTDLSGFWDFRFDPVDHGLAQNWGSGFADSRPITVPASWNDQFEDDRDNLGPAWYQTNFFLPWGFRDQQIYLRFGSVNYLADVWLNGKKIGSHEGGHLPFEFDVTGDVRDANNLLVVRVDGNLAFDRVPPGNNPAGPEDVFPSHIGNWPQTYFDFFPFCGIHRPVLLYTVPEAGMRDITVVTDIDGTTGIVKVAVDASGGSQARAVLSGHGETIQMHISLEAVTELEFRVLDAKLWSPDHPNLYDLTVEILEDGSILDSYSLRVGIRKIEITNNEILLNGKSIQLVGFGRHEDFPIYGRGYNPAVIIKDYALMKWIGANSFRTTHYPYSEQMMDLADRLGFLVIDETPAVGLFFREDGLKRRLERCQQMTRDMIARDKNHPSVIAWSLANEPHSTRPDAVTFFSTLYDLAKELDASRPVTVVSHIGVQEESFSFLDFICLNRYCGWYTQSGRIEDGVETLSAELDSMYAKFKKPLLLSEFGTDTIPGTHAQPPEMFTEEYQVEFLRQTLEMLGTKPFLIGAHVWNLCDFKTSQGVQRVGGINYKGVFTRDRRPKMAAHLLRELWGRHTAIRDQIPGN
jgi:beta-glucuronidase